MHVRLSEHFLHAHPSFTASSPPFGDGEDGAAVGVAIAISLAGSLAAAAGRNPTRSTVRFARLNSARRRRSSMRKCSSRCLSSRAHSSASDNS